MMEIGNPCQGTGRGDYLLLIQHVNTNENLPCTTDKVKQMQELNVTDN